MKKMFIIMAGTMMGAPFSVLSLTPCRFLAVPSMQTMRIMNEHQDISFLRQLIDIHMIDLYHSDISKTYIYQALARYISRQPEMIGLVKEMLNESKQKVRKEIRGVIQYIIIRLTVLSRLERERRTFVSIPMPDSYRDTVMFIKKEYWQNSFADSRDVLTAVQICGDVENEMDNMIGAFRNDYFRTEERLACMCLSLSGEDLSMRMSLYRTDPREFLKKVFYGIVNANGYAAVPLDIKNKKEISKFIKYHRRISEVSINIAPLTKMYTELLGRIEREIAEHKINSDLVSSADRVKALYWLLRGREWRPWVNKMALHTKQREERSKQDLSLMIELYAAGVIAIPVSSWADDWRSEIAGFYDEVKRQGISLKRFDIDIDLFFNNKRLGDMAAYGYTLYQSLSKRWPALSYRDIIFRMGSELGMYPDELRFTLAEHAHEVLIPGHAVHISLREKIKVLSFLINEIDKVLNVTLTGYRVPVAMIHTYHNLPDLPVSLSEMHGIIRRWIDFMVRSNEEDAQKIRWCVLNASLMELNGHYKKFEKRRICPDIVMEDIPLLKDVVDISDNQWRDIIRRFAGLSSFTPSAPAEFPRPAQEQSVSNGL